MRTYRHKLGITQEELAWRADMHRSYLADIERGGRNITLHSIVRLASALQVPVESLFSRKQEPSRLGEVLLVEDEVSDAELILRAFKRARFDNPVRVLRDGAEALNYVFCTGDFVGRRTADLPQLILLDLILPKLSGLDVLRRLKEDERTRSIPVVVLSSSKNDQDIIECGRIGAENYIIKPVSFDNLCKVTPKLSLRWALLKPVNGVEKRTLAPRVDRRKNRTGARVNQSEPKVPANTP